MVIVEPLHFGWELVGGWVYHLADDIHFSICTRKQVLKYKIQNTKYKKKIKMQNIKKQITTLLDLHQEPSTPHGPKTIKPI